MLSDQLCFSKRSLVSRFRGAAGPLVYIESSCYQKASRRPYLALETRSTTSAHVCTHSRTRTCSSSYDPPCPRRSVHGSRVWRPQDRNAALLLLLQRRRPRLKLLISLNAAASEGCVSMGIPVFSHVAVYEGLAVCQPVALISVALRLRLRRHATPGVLGDHLEKHTFSAMTSRPLRGDAVPRLVERCCDGCMYVYVHVHVHVHVHAYVYVYV